MPTKRLSFFILFLVPYLSLSAQGFCVEGVFSSPRKGTAQLTLYEDASSPRVLKARVRDGKCLFEGRVSQPVVAELWHGSMAAPLLFYVENSTIRITVNDRQPARSPVSGSRSNSEYRLVAEQWDDQPAYSSPYAPLVLLQRGADATLLADFDRLQGDACRGPQYQQLRQRVERLRATQEGAKLPPFVFVDSSHHAVSTDTLLCDTANTVFLFGASYCSQCEQAQRQLAGADSRWHTVVCRLDDDPRGWDAEWVDRLAIDHIPYILLVAPDGTILERDLRIWELEKRTNLTNLTNRTN